MTTQTTHSPLPWTFHGSACTHGGYGKCREGCHVEGIWSESGNFVANPLWIADRPFILTAVNNHYAMKEALEGLLEALGDVGVDRRHEAVARARAVLARVRGEE